jgi:hypothetical protein
MTDIIIAQLNMWAWMYVCVLTDFALIFTLLTQWSKYWHAPLKKRLAISIFSALLIAIFGKNYSDDLMILIAAAASVLIASFMLWLTLELFAIAKAEFEKTKKGLSQ